ncbi:seryl-tRNA synthetase [Clostridium acetobutylicum]|uniref:Serine--tRNA ligase 2 n=1 Tax=Clostridium acetobutylicum (strain ATCC 824 / DSM 792 / JCM 1419 / IAM 19013 / LMG 5710 / NBRC 13948 / NRRL B-527 / VKM B-1787 / 2291 / W) TaxID=272562 RepID=SYS2_CLOAB|nr:MULTISPECIES: serine--tRNA ligase [Clostridium]Q97N21.1 RecName: Full=Serine--tRNA ligase 2; AltName: Full=Seryl-tRNA synthetase 2; Short=SerRS 2; AltName: Full=Seryl-tRNA(Ser/Sec) synthetase 2 [Clostridium acetobutylicum ATCC 824]AAK78004.1 Seryl-tRNA synthetase [Clostridium acetobutylicum ATCC 824]ADZ19060.1 seryl-tRNA synthetase [Clostridium acetobutylicum EA 2018]AEI34214.1 seryl-tRNA synthetase [Clostridium acetobutylicum DSM 1731]AWV81933.1 serine--tRNA ligase [Clostridium acetobutyli
MLDLDLIRNDTEKVKKALLKKIDNVDFTELLKLDDERRKLIHEVEVLKNKKNEASKQISNIKSQGGKVDESFFKDIKEISNKISELETSLEPIKGKMDTFLEALPNIPDEDVLPGGKENNKVVHVYGEKPQFEFEPKDHVELSNIHDLIDYKRGTKLSGNGFWIYKGYGAILEWALLNYFIEEHIKDGYEFILPPHILNYECGRTAGQFPKFKDEVFKVGSNGEGEGMQFILPTAETALVNLHRDEILKEDELPKKYFAYTPCYRVEAGSYRASERGMIRGHQFNKIEMFQYTKPEDSDAALEELIGKAEKLVKGLGLHYRLSKLAAADCSASMAKTYDIEVWIPSMNEYKEVSSASNARDYQARRGKIRFRREETKKIEYVNTLNASGLATSRVLPAILEQMQDKDGSIVVPEVLRKWVGKDKL